MKLYGKFISSDLAEAALDACDRDQLGAQVVQLDEHSFAGKRPVWAVVCVSDEVVAMTDHYYTREEAERDALRANQIEARKAA